ncbi:hypothetical protein ACH5RR_024430 [Cinchona calisaya]|uniref:Uncharacterized protein n=1 Tax=Cinchona calisaya TaxID=153742 RepID=A0ABD2Z1Q7_9GENT
MQKFLQNFEQSNGFKFVVSTNQKNVTIYDKLRGIKLPTCSAYKMELTKSSSVFREIINSELRTSHPSDMRVVSCSSSESLQFIKEMIMTREENPNCCHYYSQKCWRHYLKDVKIVETVDHTTFTFKWLPLSG